MSPETSKDRPKTQPVFLEQRVTTAYLDCPAFRVFPVAQVATASLAPQVSSGRKVRKVFLELMANVDAMETWAFLVLPVLSAILCPARMAGPDREESVVPTDFLVFLDPKVLLVRHSPESCAASLDLMACPEVPV